MNSKKKRRGQMSEAFCTAMFLSLSGGLQDVYTYLFCRICSGSTGGSWWCCVRS